VLSIRELLALGVAPRTITHRCRPRGPWTRLLPGVVLLAAVPPTRDQQVRAALTYGGHQAMVTGRDAVRRAGAQLPLGPDVHLLIPIGRQRKSCDFALLERTARLPAPLERDGVGWAPVTRAVLDSARRMQRADEVRAALAGVVQRSLTTAARLLAELDAGSSRGSALPRAVLRDEIMAGVHSVAEAAALRLARRSGLPAPMWNVDVCTCDGRFLARPDAWFDDVALAWEIDSHEFHLSPADHARTLDRDASLTAEGVAVLHTLPNQLVREPTKVLETLARAYRQAACRPRPPVRTRLP
jgi:hypothetical protein